MKLHYLLFSLIALSFTVIDSVYGMAGHGVYMSKKQRDAEAAERHQA